MDLAVSKYEGQTNSDRAIETPVRFPKSARYSTNKDDKTDLSTHDVVVDK